MNEAVQNRELVRARGEDETRERFDAGLAYMRNWPAQFRLLRSQAGVDALPLGPDEPGAAGVGILGGQSLALVTDARNADAATRFIQFATDGAAQRIAATYGLAPALPHVYDDESLRQAMPYMDQVRSALERARPRPVHSQYRQFAQVLSDRVLPFLTGDTTTLSSKFIDEITAKLDPGAR